MRVLHVTTEFPPIIYGGLGTAVGGLVNASAGAEMIVAVLLIGGALVIDGKVVHAYGRPTGSEDHDGREVALTSIDGVQFFQLPWNDPQQLAVGLVRSWRPDVVHLHTHWAWPVAQAIRDETGTCLVYTVHSVDRAEYELGEEGVNLLDRCDDQEAALTSADCVIALTHHERELLSRYYPAVRHQVRIVGNGINDYAGSWNGAIRHSPDKPTLVLYSGRLVERKGISELLAAVPKILTQVPSTHFVLAGGPAHWCAADVESQWLTPELHCYRDRIHFTGWLTPTQVAGWYRQADVLVVPSRYEPFGMVVLEGMLHGLPIVAAEVGGPKEILRHEWTGLLVPPKNADALAHAVLRLIQNPALRRRIGNAAARDVRRKWLWPHAVKKVRDVYLEALGSKGAAVS
jgi:glycosyltransferase involved in cell wall biosynthesis